MAWVDSESSLRPISEYGRNFVGLYPKIGSATNPKVPVSVKSKFLALHELKTVITKQLTLKLEQAQRLCSALLAVKSILVQRRTEKTEPNYHKLDNASFDIHTVDF